jgi:threonylcarbamoyladenosine tRNA methylthiotransferase MtaB
MKAAFYTFGCKLNQLETEALASAFRCQGFSIVKVNQQADFYIINTCTVTSKSEQKARGLIRSLARSHPQARLIVTGCYAQMNESVLAELADNLVVVPQNRKDTLLDLPGLLRRQSGEPVNLKQLPAGPGAADMEAAHGTAAFDVSLKGLPTVSPPYGHSVFRFQVEQFSFHSRAFLKIQDGCDYGCAYCRIPLARGGAVSLNPEEALSRAVKLEKQGYREVVLTGVNITSYNCRGWTLPELITGFLKVTSSMRLRLSSLEPEMINEQLVDTLSDRRVCPHFHIPLQSGSDRVLMLMGRRYKAERVSSAVDLLRKVKPETFLAADVLIGFPGESEDDFQATRELVKELGFSRLHVFPFSPRPGTAAEKMKEHTPERIRDQRVKELIRLSKELLERYKQRFVGRRVEAILERSSTAVGVIPASAPSSTAAGVDPVTTSAPNSNFTSTNAASGEERAKKWRGLTENYLKIEIEGIPQNYALAGRLVAAEITHGGEIYRARFLEPVEYL